MSWLEDIRSNLFIHFTNILSSLCSDTVIDVVGSKIKDMRHDFYSQGSSAQNRKYLYTNNFPTRLDVIRDMYGRIVQEFIQRKDLFRP